MAGSQGDFYVGPYIDGSIEFRMPGYFRVSPAGAVEIAKAILKVAGVETVVAERGQTVIRPPRLGIVR